MLPLVNGAELCSVRQDVEQLMREPAIVPTLFSGLEPLNPKPRILPGA